MLLTVGTLGLAGLVLVLGYVHVTALVPIALVPIALALGGLGWIRFAAESPGRLAVTGTHVARRVVGSLS